MLRSKMKTVCCFVLWIGVRLKIGATFSPIVARISSTQQQRHYLVGHTRLFSEKLLGNVQEQIVPLLLTELRKEPQNATLVSSYIERLEHCDSNSSERRKIREEVVPDRFDPLLGLYDVAFVKTAREGDNPVGGKWTRKSGIAQKLLRTRRSFQHILAVNETGCGKLRVQTGAGEWLDVVGEAVNVISLDALWGLLRTTVILRGDAVALNATERASGMYCQPLSPLAVRALFDAPRVIIGQTGRLLNVNVGPRTSVVLDTVYTDDKVRIGLGGKSGSRFVFARCANNEAEANEFRALLARTPWSKYKTITALAAMTGAGMLGGATSRGLVRVAGVTLTVFSALVGTMMAFSDGGIEAVDRSVTESKNEQPKSDTSKEQFHSTPRSGSR